MTHLQIATAAFLTGSVAFVALLAAVLWLATRRESAAGNTRCETGPQRLRRYD